MAARTRQLKRIPRGFYAREQRQREPAWRPGPRQRFKKQFEEVIQIREQAAVGQQMAVEAIRTQDAPVAPPPSVTTAAPMETSTTTPGDFETAELGAVPTLAGVP